MPALSGPRTTSVYPVGSKRALHLLDDVLGLVVDVDQPCLGAAGRRHLRLRGSGGP